MMRVRQGTAAGRQEAPAASQPTHSSSSVIDASWLQPHTFMGVTSIMMNLTRCSANARLALRRTWHWHPSTSIFSRSTYLADSAPTTTVRPTIAWSTFDTHDALGRPDHFIDSGRVHDFVLGVDPVSACGVHLGHIRKRCNP